MMSDTTATSNPLNNTGDVESPKGGQSPTPSSPPERSVSRSPSSSRLTRASSFMSENFAQGVEIVGKHVDKKQSPFVKHTEAETASYSEQAVAFVYDKFVANLPLPSIQKLTAVPRVLAFGMLAYSVYFVLFLYFAIVGYLQARKEEFVSLKKDSGICNEVMKPLTGDFIGGSNGKWQGDIDFKNSLGAYEFSFTSLQTTDEGFAEELTKLQTNELTLMGAHQENFALHYNLLIWMHFSSYFTVSDKVQVFGFTAHPGDVFDREYVLAKMQNGQHFCTETPRVSFEPTYGRASLNYNLEAYELAGCDAIANPDSLGYDAEYDGGTFTIDMDVVSMTSALAVNMGILRKTHLQTIGDPEYVTAYNSEYLYFQSYYDPRYPRMTPLHCFDFQNFAPTIDDDFFEFNDDVMTGSTDFASKCVLKLSESYLIPTFFHYWPECQSCDDYEPSPFNICNDFDIVVSYIYFENNDNINQIIDLLNKYPNAQDLNEAAFVAYSNGDFSFCDNACSLLTLNVYDGIDTFMSPDFYTLSEGHCRDSTDKEALTALGATPPTELVETYYRCKHTKGTSFFRSVGIANSNMMFFAPFFFALVLSPFMAFYHQYVIKEKMTSDEFSDAEREQALKVLATQLMKLAHGKEDELGDPNRVIVRLAKDLNRIGSRMEDSEQLQNSEKYL